jgi:hypothetical protein
MFIKGLLQVLPLLALKTLAAILGQSKLSQLGL